MKDQWRFEEYWYLFLCLFQNIFLIYELQQMENLSSMVLQSVSQIMKKIKKLDLNEQMNRLFQIHDLNTRYKQNYLINQDLMEKLIRYCLLRAYNCTKIHAVQQQLVRLHLQLKKDIQQLEFLRSKHRKTSQLSLYNIITLIELASALLTHHAPTLPLTLNSAEIFISLVYILTNRLVSQNCYHILRRKMKRQREAVGISRRLKSKRRLKTRGATVDCLLEYSSLVSDFANSLKASLYTNYLPTDIMQSIKTNQSLHASKHPKHAAHNYFPKQATPSQRPSQSKIPNQATEPPIKHRVSLESILIVKEHCQARTRHYYTASSSKNDIGLEDKIKHIMTNHKQITRLRLP